MAPHRRESFFLSSSSFLVVRFAFFHPWLLSIFFHPFVYCWYYMKRALRERDFMLLPRLPGSGNNITKADKYEPIKIFRLSFLFHF